MGYRETVPLQGESTAELMLGGRGWVIAATKPIGSLALLPRGWWERNPLPQPFGLRYLPPKRSLRSLGGLCAKCSEVGGNGTPYPSPSGSGTFPLNAHSARLGTISTGKS